MTQADEAALRLLLSQRLYNTRFDVSTLICGCNIVFDSIQSFCENSRATLADMEIDGHIPDAYTIFRTSAGKSTYIVLYDSGVKSSGRRRFTLAHEIGHILLQHTESGPRQEYEADIFAAQLLLPRIFAWEIFKSSGFSVSVRELAVIFGVSAAVAENRLRTLTKEHPPTFSASEIELLNKFGGLLPRLDEPHVDC